MKTTRRTFLGTFGLGAAASLVGPAAFAAPKRPLFRVGLLTDTHIHDNPKSCDRVEKAMRLLKREKVDVICHLGDLANEFAPHGFEEYRRQLDLAFGDKTPLTLYAFGGHDRNGYKLKPGEKNREESVFAIMREKMKIPHDLCDIVDFKGYKFVILQEYFSLKTAEELVEKAIAANRPGRPVFVLEHEPAWNTTCDSVVWGNRKILSVLSKHPEVVHFSGHNHCSLRDERTIWQGAFTEVNLGCLDYWGGEEANFATRRNDWKPKAGHTVAVMDVFPGALVIHRFSINDGAECRPLDPWTLPVPLDATKGAYRPSARKAKSKPPVWTKGAALAVEWKTDGLFRGYTLSFPEAKHRDETFRYTAELFEKKAGAWARVTLKERMGEFWKNPGSARSKAITIDFPDGYFTAGGDYRFAVKPMDFYGNFGKPLVVEVTAPDFAAEAEPVWRSAEPMKECRITTHNWGRDRKEVPIGADGFAEVKGDMASVDLPGAATIAAEEPAGTTYRLSYTLEDEHAEGTGWLVQNENAATGKRLGFRYLQSVQGKAGPIRYVTYLVKPDAAALPVRIGFMYGDRGSRLRFTDLTLEKLK